MKLVLRFSLEKLEKLSFKKRYSKIVLTKLSEIFFWKVPKNDDRNRAIELDFKVIEYQAQIEIDLGISQNSLFFI